MKVLKVHEIPLEKLEPKRNAKTEYEIKKRLLLAIDDDSLSQTLGDVATKNIYLLLEQKCHMKPEDIPDNARALPFTKMVDAMKAIMTRNLPFDAVMPEMVYLTVSGIILFIMGTIAYRMALNRL
jgi:hypothetical protein